jgi:hypothetical protein
MPAVHEDDSPRRSVVPTAAARSLWPAAVWTGAGAAVVCATLAIVAVAICWLPVSGSTGRSHSAIHAGLLTFLASVHGGITVDAMTGSFLPLGMMIAVGLTAWRAGVGLADVADDIDERDPLRLALAAATQAASFAITCLVMVPFSSLGTSSAPFLGVGLAALLLFGAVGGTALAIFSPLSDWILERLPALLGRSARAAGAVVALYLASGAVLVAASLVVHRDSVETLSRQVGGGWGGVPILLLGALAAPNAVIAAASYLAGPGFAVGAGTTASAFTTAHGTLPAFPSLGAVPVGHGASPALWALMALTPVLAGTVLARLAWREDGWRARLQFVGVAVAFVAFCLLVLGWQAGGSIGDGRLSTVGASPWKLGLAVAVVAGTIACAGLAVAAGTGAIGAHDEDRPVRPLRTSTVDTAPTGKLERAEAKLAGRAKDDRAGDAGKGDQLAG